MEHVISNFENSNCKSELEVKMSLLEKQNFGLRVQLIDKMVIKTNSKSYQFTTDAFRTRIKITTLVPTYNNINSNNDNNNNNSISNNNINSNNCKTRTITPPTTKITRSVILTRTIIALMKRQLTTKS